MFVCMYSAQVAEAKEDQEYMYDVSAEQRNLLPAQPVSGLDVSGESGDAEDVWRVEDHLICCLSPASACLCTGPLHTLLKIV